MRSFRAFTLIELLVVITIIVVLLSLLAPAMDRAIYQAELAVCAANQHGIGANALTYAAQFRRYYPSRPDVVNTPGNWEPPRLNETISPEPPFQQKDDRPLLFTHFSPRQFLCPLAGEVDLGIEANGEETTCTAGFSLYFAWKWAGTGGGPGMFKIGDRFGWTGPDAAGQIKTYSFDLLACDYDMQIRLSNYVIGSHPDRDGSMRQTVLQNEGFDSLVDDTLFGPFTVARWESNLTYQRGPIDRNFLHDDGSVRRISDNRYDDWEAGRMARVPQYASDNTGSGDWSAHLPIR